MRAESTKKASIMTNGPTEFKIGTHIKVNMAKVHDIAICPRGQ